MKKSKGFIATSLIYSFFLVFIAVIMALLNNYLSNKTILTRFNEEIINNLNEPPYTVTIYSTSALNSSASDLTTGTITNLLKNGNFKQDFDYWTKVGSINASVASDSLVIESTSERNSYIQQTSGIELTANHLYYIAGYYSQPLLELSLSVGFNGNTNIFKTQKTSQGEWIHFNNLYKPNTDGTEAFIIGKYDTSYSGFARFKDLLAVDVTNSFDTNLSESWLNNNIIWFEGTMNYIMKSGIESGENITINLTNYTLTNITCSNANGQMAVSTSQNGTTASISVNQIKSDVKCVVNA